MLIFLNLFDLDKFTYTTSALDCLLLTISFYLHEDRNESRM